MPDSLTRPWHKRILLATLLGWVIAVVLCFTIVTDEGRAGNAHSWQSALLATLLAGGTAAFVGVPTLRRRLGRFLLAPMAPLNLAVLRIVVFTMLLLLLTSEPIREYAAWPREDFKWPLVAGSIMSQLPINAEIVGLLLPIAIVFTLLAILGLVTRISTLASATLSTYLLGITQCTGEVHHTMHHVVLIGLLVSLSRSGDALSIDSLWYAIRRADQGIIGRFHRSVRYGLPIRCSMMVIALCYFFPGYWKVASGGLIEIAGDSVNSPTVLDWVATETHGFVFSLYQIPGFLAIAAVAAVVMEMGWPIALLWKKTRYLWAFLGLLLHNITKLFENYGSYTMQAMYVMFVDWQRLLAWFGRKLYPGPMFVMYDGNCKMCRRTMSILLNLDWLESLEPVSAFERTRIDELGLNRLDDEALMRDMHAAQRDTRREWNVSKGYAAYQQIAWRVPLLWITLPIVYLKPVVALGTRIYRHIADTRACQVPPRQAAPGPRGLRWWPVPFLALAIAILSTQVILGIGRIENAWPIACYPLLQASPTPSVRGLDSRYSPTIERSVGKLTGREELSGRVEHSLRMWEAASDVDGSHPGWSSVYIANIVRAGTPGVLTTCGTTKQSIPCRANNLPAVSFRK